jgi:dTDP-4-amino-4,6-dideoxygalactose transaminase
MDARTDETYFKWPRISEQAIGRVVEMLRAGTTSFDLPTYEALEADVGRLFGVRHALCCNNGTAASYSAFRALGLGPGDTVIAPAITHWASVLPAVQCGARVALADVQPDTCHIDPASVRSLIDSTTRAVVVTHMFGEPLGLDELRALCDAHGLALVEDVSHAHGASFQGRPVGSFGDVSFCSFQGAKLVSAGEGGALLTNRQDLYYRAMEVGHPRRLQEAPREWQALAGVGRGFKFRPSALLAALAHDSLRLLAEQNAVRRRACDQLRAILAASTGFSRLDRAPAGRVYFRCELLLAPDKGDLRDRLVDGLAAQGIRAHRLVGYLPGHPSLDGHSAHAGPWPAAQDVMRRIFFLEAFTAYSAPLIDRYGRTILKTLRELSRGS